MEPDIKEISPSKIEITAEIPAVDFEKAYVRVLKKYNDEANIPGFRAGHVPEHVLREKIGDETILREAAETTIQEWYRAFLSEKKIDAIGPPEVHITKLARNNPLGITLKTAILPKIELPDYKTIAKSIIEKKDDITVEDKEIDDTLEHLKKSKLKTQNAKQDEGEKKEIQLDDEFAKSVGKFNTITELRETIRTNITMEKEMKKKEEKRMAALDAIAKETPLSIPDIMIEGEKEKMVAELRSSIEQMGMKWEDYLAHVKKTEEEIKKGWDEQAKKRVTYGLLLHTIAQAENIDVPEEELNTHVENMKKQYPQEQISSINEDRLRQHAYGMLKNEKTFQVLEK